MTIWKVQGLFMLLLVIHGIASKCEIYAGDSLPLHRSFGQIRTLEFRRSSQIATLLTGKYGCVAPSRINAAIIDMKIYIIGISTLLYHFISYTICENPRLMSIHLTRLDDRLSLAWFHSYWPACFFPSS